MSENFIVGGRGTGKTKKLLEYAHEHNCTVLCSNPAAMRKKAESYGIVGLDIRPYYSISNIDNPQSLIKEAVVDEMTDFLSYWFDYKVTGFTQSEE